MVDDTCEVRHLLEPGKSAEELCLRMRPSLEPAEELEHEAVIERDHGVGQIFREESGSARNRLDTRAAR